MRIPRYITHINIRLSAILLALLIMPSAAYMNTGDGAPSSENRPAAGSGLDFFEEVMNETTGIITTVAGNRSKGFSGDGGPAINAGFNFPVDVAIDGAGNLFILDSSNRRIRRVDAKTGIIATAAGNGIVGFSGDGGPAIKASLGFENFSGSGIGVDGKGNLFIAERENHRIRKVDAATGFITTVAGNGKSGFSGDGGLAINASLNYPADLAIDEAGNLFIADERNNRIRRVDAITGIITTAVGRGFSGFSGDGGPAINAGIQSPTDVVVDGAGNLFIVDRFNSRIRKIDAKTGVITTVAGNGDVGFGGDGGPAVNASLAGPTRIAVDQAGNLFFADPGNLDTPPSNRIRKIDAKTGVITTVAGNGDFSFSGDGGPAVNASLAFAVGVALDRQGNLFIADTFNDSIRAVTGIGVGVPTEATIGSITFAKPELIIEGTGFILNTKVIVNGQDVSSRIVVRSDAKITLKGNKKKLNLKKGENQIFVNSGGIASNIFILTL